MDFSKIFKNSFIDNWDLTAVTNYDTRLTLTYGNIAARLARVQRLLDKLGIKRGDHVAIVGTNSIDWITNYMSVLMYGAVAVTVQVSYDANAVDLLETVDVKALFVDPDIKSRYDELSSLSVAISQDTQQVLWCDDESYHQYLQGYLNNLDIEFAELFPKGFSVYDFVTPDANGDETAAIFFTAGTMGVPKAVMLSYDNLEGSLIFGLNAALYRRGERSLTTASMGNVWGTIVNVLIPLASGVNITVFNHIYCPEMLVEALMDVKPRRVIMSPRQLRGVYGIIENRFYSSRLYGVLKFLPLKRTLCHAALRHTFNKSMGGKCEEVIVASNNVEHKLRTRLESVGINYTVSYGLTEFGGIVTYAPWDTLKKLSVGKPISNAVKIRLRPIELKGLPEDLGIIEAKGMCMMKGYYNDDEATAAAFTSDEWMSTQDLATIDSQGNILIAGRLDSIISRPEGYVIPERLEATLLEYPEISQAVVVDRDGLLTAIIYPADELNDRTNDVIQRIIDKVNDYIPDYIHIDNIELSPVPLEITLKGTIARFNYQ